METIKEVEPKKDSQRKYANLDKRYGKIGIPAVAAALQHHDEPRSENEPRTSSDQRD